MIADIAKEILIEHGYEVCGIARTVAGAVALAQHHKPDLVVLDLRRRRSGHRVVLTTADGDACLSKPYRSVDLLRDLEIVAEIISTGRASPPFPKGFQVLSAATALSGVAA
jgi:DNA-binding NarL/FixJ family response regulator